jgi:hypothetical protein
MLHRLYILFPEPAQAERAVDLIQDHGVRTLQIHAIAREGVDISGLPPATDWQRHDTAARVERVLWDLNLGLFGLFVAVFAAAVAFGGWGLAVVALVVMAATFAAGYWFVSHVPHAHIDECRAAIRHGEVLLMVDIPRQRLPKLHKAIVEAHPEAEIGGVGWAMESLPI